MSNPPNAEDNPPNAGGNRAIVIERFWQRMQEAVGVIPVRVIAFLDLLQLSASNGLTEERDWGTSVYDDINNEGTALFDEAVQFGIMKRSRFEVFGRHADNMQEFRLTGAESAAINAIANMVRERGIMYFIGEEQPPALPVDGPPAPSEVELQATLSRRLNDYFNSKPEYFGINAFDNVRLNLAPEQPPNEIKVQVECVRCPHRLRCTKVGPNWHVSNYVAHVKRKHKPRRSGVYQNTRSHLQLPDNEDSDSEFALEEETFTSGSYTGTDESRSTGSTHGGNESDTEGATAAEQADPSAVEAAPATNRTRRSRVADLVDMFSAGPSTSKGSKN